VRVILKVWSSNHDINGGCDFAVVEITLALAELALRRIAALCEQKVLDPAVDETYYWGSEVEFFSPWTDLANQTEEIKAACLKLEEELESLQVNRREMVTAAHGSSVPQSQIARVECAQMVVREEGIAFTAIPKHNDFYVTTAEIPKGVLEQAAMAI
jgi:sulfur carrier protein ThiS